MVRLAMRFGRRFDRHVFAPHQPGAPVGDHVAAADADIASGLDIYPVAADGGRQRPGVVSLVEVGDGGGGEEAARGDVARLAPVLAGFARFDADIAPGAGVDGAGRAGDLRGAGGKVLSGGERHVALGLDDGPHVPRAALVEMILRIPHDVVLLGGGDTAEDEIVAGVDQRLPVGAAVVDDGSGEHDIAPGGSHQYARGAADVEAGDAFDAGADQRLPVGAAVVDDGSGEHDIAPGGSHQYARGAADVEAGDAFDAGADEAAGARRVLTVAGGARHIDVAPSQGHQTIRGVDRAAEVVDVLMRGEHHVAAADASAEIPD